MANDCEGICAAANLTPGAAFVVHLAVRSADAAAAPAPEQGRVEHVLSGAVAYFHSIADLVTFMSETVACCHVHRELAPVADAGRGRREIAPNDSS